MNNSVKSKVLTALLAIGVALVLWFYVVTVVSPNSDNRYSNIPVTLQGLVVLQERGLMITTDELPTAELHLEGNRTDLNKLNSNNISIGVDVSGIGAPGIYELKLGNPSFPSDVPNTAITVLNKSPGTIRIQVENRITKPVPVDIVYNDTNFDSENYMADKENRILSDEAITVSGPESVVSKIALARIEVDLSGRVESIIDGNYPYTLCDEKGEPVDVEKVTTDAEDISLTLKIVRVKEVPLVFKEIIYSGGATEENTTVTIDPQTQVILVSGSDALLAGLEKIELDTIDLSLIPEDTELTLPIVMPEGITNETGIQEVKVAVKFSKLVTKTLVINDIKTVNVPEGLKVTPAAKRLEILVRGPQALVDKLTAEQVTVQLDCANVQQGNVSLKAAITVNVQGVGAVGVYNVTATVDEK